MSTLAVVEEILRETAVPMSVREIVERAGEALPTKSKTPDTVVARDLSMDIKKKGEASSFIRTSPGRYTLREIHMSKLAEETRQGQAAQPVTGQDREQQATPVLEGAMKEERAGTRASEGSRARSESGEESSSVPA